ncbi:MAG TPA: XrtA/PEP-CTERM system histidine kinase PrsK [Candidatus Sulfotelmatobacter sp.]|nr:XrtA/PEP-CTERM system histidine kinase PrsK [Candidatus Sulfotelmatobacter sp.]
MIGSDIVGFAAAAACFGLALMVAFNRQLSPVRWAFIIGMSGLAADNTLFALTTGAVLPSEMIFWQKWKLILTSFLSPVWFYFSISYACGNKSELLKSWRAFVLAAFAVPVGLGIFCAGDLIVSAGQTVSGQWMFRLGIAGAILNASSLLAVILILMNLESTFRAAIGTMLWRIKFMILGLGLIIIVQGYISSQVLLFHNTLNLTLQTVGAMGSLFGAALISRSLFRPGHFETHVYPSKFLLRTSLTLLLAGVYFFIVGIFAKLVVFLGSNSSFTLKAFILLVVLVLVTVLALSNRMRQSVSRFMSRQFQRPVYDYRSMWRRFTEETASAVVPAELCQAIVKFVADVLQTLSVSIWLVDDKRQNFIFATSTFLSQAKANALKLTDAQAIAVIHALEKRPEPVDIDASSGDWAAALKLCHPDEFRSGGDRVCAPLMSGGQLLGVIILGDRVKGLPFSWQDFDLLKCVADSAAAGLLNIQLSQKLLRAGQMEAFQTMSTFFVHDLKNTISTLNLMLKNLPGNFDNPEFREDALRGISKTIGHINHLIQRLGQLRGRLQIKPVASDLNELVLSVLSGVEAAPTVNLVKSIHPLPKILLDQEQMQKVVTNLLFNAREAISPEGEVRIETSQNNGWAVLSVSDNGCGMNPEFLNHSLFRPFQTTKKNGLGIGLFQSKMIVEAHKGRIQVESEPGKGTTFRIILPIPKQTHELQTTHC